LAVGLLHIVGEFSTDGSRPVWEWSGAELLFSSPWQVHVADQFQWLLAIQPKAQRTSLTPLPLPAPWCGYSCPALGLLHHERNRALMVSVGLRPF
jgi:hypothetical protein